MMCSDWIQVGLSAITLAGVAIALLQPIFQRKNDRTAREKTVAAKQQIKVDRIKKVVSLYLDVLEVKAEVDKNVFRKAGDSLVSKGKFEDYNQKNYDALELTFLDANELPENQYVELRKFVKYCKISKNMRDDSDLDRFLRRIRKHELRKAFPRNDDVSVEIDEATV